MNDLFILAVAGCLMLAVPLVSRLLQEAKQSAKRGLERAKICKAQDAFSPQRLGGKHRN